VPVFGRGRVRAVKTETIRLLIIIFVVLPLFASVLIPAGRPHYRLKERLEAMKAYTLNPSPATKAALDDEFARLHQHENKRDAILIPALLIVDAVVIYFFWNYGTRKRTT
jgi:hypothetical protein